MKEYPYGVWQDDYHGDLHIKDITKEYLENKCVKIESPEHSEFVQKLAFKAGYSWNAGKNVAFTDKEYLFFSGTRITWFWNNENSTEEIQLPMSPEASEENPETKEWPQVGDEVSFPSGKGILVVDKPDKNGIIIVKSTDEDSIDEYKKVSLNALKKPLTPEEKLRDELINTTIKVMSDDSYDLTHNAYYLISGLMKIYDIKKKLK